VWPAKRSAQPRPQKAALPRRGAKEIGMADLLIDHAVAPPRVRILVVEDDTNIREFCRLLLRQRYDVLTAEHGREAVALLAEHPVDLVLTDLQMPVMGGLELLQHIRLHHPEVDSVVLTAHATVDTARQALKLGALDYLSKPVEAENLERTMRTCLELRRVRQEKERLSDLLFMFQFSQLIATSLDIPTQVEQIVEFLWRRFAPETLALSMHLPDEARLCLLAARTGEGWAEQGAAIPLAAGPSETDLRLAHLRLAGGPGTCEEGQYAGVVLRSHDTPVGYLHMGRRPEQPPFDAGERRLLSIFAGQVAASLDNARLYSTLKDQNRQTIEALAEAIEARDAYTSGHSRQVTRYAVRLGEVLGLPPERIELLTYAGLLHDVGKIGIRDDILLKPGPLSDDEFAIMQRHPRIGVKIIERVRGLRAALPIIEAHHERVDGGGYPAGLRGEQIPVEARILAIADCFEAMTSDRPYRPAMETERALQQLLRGRGTHWDAKMVDAFVALVRREERELRIALPGRPEALELREGKQAVAVGDVRD